MGRHKAEQFSLLGQDKNGDDQQQDEEVGH